MRAFLPVPLRTQTACGAGWRRRPSRKSSRSRFIAGETLDEELRCVRSAASARKSGRRSIIWARTSRRSKKPPRRRRLSGRARRASNAKLPATVSIKLTQFGLDLSEDACLENVRRLRRERKHRAAGSRSIWNRPPIPIARCTWSKRSRRKFGCTRCVIQAYLHRSAADVERLNQLADSGALVQGRLRRAAVGCLRRKARRRSQLRHADEDAARRRNVSRHRHARRAHRRRGVPLRARARNPAGAIRISDALRNPPRSAAAHRRPRAIACACTCPTAPPGIRTSCAAWPSGRRTSFSDAESVSLTRQDSIVGAAHRHLLHDLDPERVEAQHFARMIGQQRMVASPDPPESARRCRIHAAARACPSAAG